MASWLGDFPCLKRELASLEIMEEVASTNDHLKWDEILEYEAVLTGHQSAGRGRLGREWVLVPNEGVAFSFVVPKLSSLKQHWLPLVVGAALANAARFLGFDRAVLKWPNDVLIEERKISGILCEKRADDRVIVGIGLNLDFAGATRPSPGAASLGEFAEVSHFLVDNLLAKVVASVKIFCEALEKDSQILAHGLVTTVLATIGREVSVQDVKGTAWRGLALSLTKEGHLLVREETTGEQRVIVASDVLHLRQ